MMISCTTNVNESNETFGYEVLENQKHIIKEITIDEIKEKEKHKET